MFLIVHARSSKRIKIKEIKKNTVVAHQKNENSQKETEIVNMHNKFFSFLTYSFCGL